MARTPWRGNQSYTGKNRVIGLTGADSHALRRARLSQLSELPCRYAMLLHLKVHSLIVGSEEPHHLALVPTGDLEGPADGLPLGAQGGL